MLLDLTDDQRLLRESLDRFLTDRYGFEHRRKYQREPAGFSRAIWSGFAELGLLGLQLPVEQDGFGGTSVDTMVVMEAMGRALVVEPFLATVLLGGTCVSLAGSAEQRARILPAMMAGECLLGFAHAEPQARYELTDVETTARRVDGGWVLDGRKSLVLHGASADWLVISARTASGLSLFMVEGSAVTRRAYPTHDGMQAADLVMDGVRLGDDALLGAEGEALPVIERVVDGANAAMAAELVGIMTALQALTLEHLKTRVQFDRVIGSNQVLQHRAVDMVIATEQARSMAMLAAIRMQEDGESRRLAVASAKAVAGRAATTVARDAVQLHGGMGVTLEHPVGHYFKRVAAIEASFGNADHHIATVARAGGMAGAIA